MYGDIIRFGDSIVNLPTLGNSIRTGASQVVRWGGGHHPDRSFSGRQQNLMFLRREVAFTDYFIRLSFITVSSSLSKAHVFTFYS